MRRRDFSRDERGAAAVEFAIVMPAALVILLGVVGLGFGLWYKNLLHDVAAEAARCLAIGATDCSEAVPGCAASTSVCHVVALAGRRGLSNLPASAVVVDPNARLGSVAATQVSITYVLDLAGFDLVLAEDAAFPNS